MSHRGILVAAIALISIMGSQACRNAGPANPPDPFDTSSDTEFDDDTDSSSHSDTDADTDVDTGPGDTDTFDTDTFDTDTGTVIPCIYDCIPPLYPCGSRGQDWHLEMDCPPGKRCCDTHAKNHLEWECLICEKPLPFD